MDPGRLRNLTFLMSLGGLWPGCFNDEGLQATGATTGTTTGTTDATTGTTEPTTTSGSADTTTTGTTTGEPVTSTTTTTGEPVTSTADITTSTGVDTTDGSTTEAGPDGQACVQHGAKYGECYPQYLRYVDEVIAGCAETLATGNTLDGPMCGEALEEWFACITSLDCSLIEQEYDNPTFCVGPGALVDGLCPHIDL